MEARRKQKLFLDMRHYMLRFFFLLLGCFLFHSFIYSVEVKFVFFPKKSNFRCSIGMIVVLQFKQINFDLKPKL